MYEYLDDIFAPSQSKPRKVQDEVIIIERSNHYKPMEDNLEGYDLFYKHEPYGRKS